MSPGAVVTAEKAGEPMRSTMTLDFAKSAVDGIDGVAVAVGVAVTDTGDDVVLAVAVDVGVPVFDGVAVDVVV